MELRIPGPTPCPPETLEAMGRQMINHRGEEFAKIIESITSRLKGFLKTTGDVLLLTGSGTGGMEAAVVNCFSPGDRALVVSCGYFGERFADLAEQFGVEVQRLRFEWGKAVDPKEVSRALSADPKIKAVLVTHNETSTGVTNDLKAICSAVKEQDRLLLVDAISSLGSLELPVDAWKCDVVVTASQKGWMVPPGLAMVSVSQEAWKAHAKARCPRYYWDFAKAKNMLEKGQTPWTPAVSVFYALSAALDLMEKEGFSNVIARHARVGARMRKGAKSLGLSLFPEEAWASNTVTAINVPQGVDPKKLLKLLRLEYGIVLSGGQQRLDGKIFRVGHLGWVNEADMDKVTQALGAALSRKEVVGA